MPETFYCIYYAYSLVFHNPSPRGSKKYQLQVSCRLESALSFLQFTLLITTTISATEWSTDGLTSLGILHF